MYFTECREEEIVNKCFISHLISCNRCRCDTRDVDAIRSCSLGKIHFGLFLEVLTLERLPSVQQQDTDVNESKEGHEKLCKK